MACVQVSLPTVTSQKKKRAMTPETRAKIIDAIAQEFHEAGMGDFNDAMRLLEEAPAYTELGFKVGILIRVKKILDSAVEPSAEQLEETLGNINGKLRYMLRPAILTSLKQFKKTLPYKRGGGRPRALASEEQKAAACDAVSVLVRKRVPLKEAFRRVAKEFTVRLNHDVSARSVQRAWQGRQGY